MEESVESSQSLKLDDSQETAQESEILESDDLSDSDDDFTVPKRSEIEEIPLLSLEEVSFLRKTHEENSKFSRFLTLHIENFNKHVKR